MSFILYSNDTIVVEWNDKCLKILVSFYMNWITTDSQATIKSLSYRITYELKDEREYQSSLFKMAKQII